MACKLPQLDVSNPEITKFIHDVSPLQCTPEDWVILRGSKLVISNKAKKKYGSITCLFSGKFCEIYTFTVIFILLYFIIVSIIKHLQKFSEMMIIMYHL